MLLNNEKNISSYLSSKKSELYKYAKDLLNTTNFIFEDDPYNSLLSYDLFKSFCINRLKILVQEKLNLERNYKWLNLPKRYSIGITKKILNKAIDTILSSEEFNEYYSNIFINHFSHSIKELEKIENDAIEYNKSFGEDSDELHPIENKNKDTIDEIDTYKTIEELLETGTIEDL